MYLWEIDEARKVFGDGLDYQRVRIHECNPWPNRIDRIGRRLKGMPASTLPNAITLGNHCIFPVRLPEELPPFDHPQHYKIGWLVHELTHAWQFQQMGWWYVVDALTAQMRGKAAAYDYGEEEGLKMRRREGWTLHKFNLEQQGDIARVYYDRLCKGLDVDSWLPFIDDLRNKRT